MDDNIFADKNEEKFKETEGGREGRWREKKYKDLEMQSAKDVKGQANASGIRS